MIAVGDSMRTDARTNRSILMLLVLMPLLTPIPQAVELEGHWNGMIVRDSGETVLQLDLEYRDAPGADRSASPSSACCSIHWVR